MNDVQYYCVREKEKKEEKGMAAATTHGVFRLGKVGVNGVRSEVCMKGGGCWREEKK